MFKRLCYPNDQAYLIPIVVKELDTLFYDLQPVVRQVMNPPNLLDNVSLNSLKQVYYVDDNVLRFDHTHVRSNVHTNERNFGPVFRKEPVQKGRYREFHQYDVDYVLEDHGSRPLRVLLNYLGSDFQLRCNSNDWVGWEEYEKYKDEDLTRGWDYYKGFVFQITSPRYHLSLCGGGVYEDKGVRYFGFGFGVNRFIDLMMSNSDMMEKFLPLRNVIFIAYKERIPNNLLDYLQTIKRPYHLKRITKNLRKTFTKESNIMSNHRINLTPVLIVNPEEDDNKSYYYKGKDGLEYRLDLNAIQWI